MKSYINFDVDGLWVLKEFIGKKSQKKKDIIIEKSIPRILKLLKQNKIKATFFISGSDIENYSSLFKKIIKEKHEIGNHAYSHNHKFRKLPKQVIEEEINKTHDLINDKLKVNPVGFRAPFYNYTKKIIQPLKNKNYLYDSSVLPFIYPIPSSIFKKTRPYKISGILELPLAVSQLFKIPVNGTYVRFLGKPWLRFNLTHSTFLNINFHARDAVPEISKDKELPFFAYFKIKNSLNILEYSLKLLSKKTETITLKDLAKNY